MDSSWNHVSAWYDQLVDNRGQYYHEHVILPGVGRLLALKPGDSVLDVGCGQGVFARTLEKNVRYTGIDAAPNLIALARKRDPDIRHIYRVADVTLPFPRELGVFSHAVSILALQNIEHQETVIQHISQALQPKGILVLVLLHPAFRIPRQTSWGIDEANKLQYRRINRYLTPLKIPITMHPGNKTSLITWTFHHPISDYVRFLSRSGFSIDALEEWTSDKQSVGKAAKMENRARSEFPLFLAIRARRS